LNSSTLIQGYSGTITINSQSGGQLEIVIDANPNSSSSITGTVLAIQEDFNLN
jgi:hypothetical protein